MSTHSVDVVRLGVVEKHPNADTLGLVKIGGYTTVVRLGEWKEGDLAAYIEPDYEVPLDRREFAFLRPKDKPDRKRQRVTVKRLRGILSHGLLTKPRGGAQEGDNVMEALGVTRYEPPMPLSTGGESASPPKLYAPVYDVEALRKYVHAFELEPVLVTEKIHGASGRYVFHDGQMHVGSRTEWKRQDDRNLWWRALAASPWLERFCRDNPGYVVYGEVYGQVQDLKYGHEKGMISFAVFDVLKPGGIWMNASALFGVNASIDDVPDATLVCGLQRVPLIAECVFRWPDIALYASGESLVEGADHIREGVVIKPVQERTHPEVGRVVFKLINDQYLERA